MHEYLYNRESVSNYLPTAFTYVLKIIQFEKGHFL